MKVLLRIPLSTYSGYGNDGIGMARAFMRMGADVYLDPTNVQAPIPEDLAMLLTKRLAAPFDLVIHHVDPALLEASENRAGTVQIGWSMWEYSNFGNLAGRSKMKERLKSYDAVVGYDPISSACFEPYYKGPILTVQGGYEPADWGYIERDFHEENFYFCMLGMLSPRKNPFAAIQAFGELKREDEEFDKRARLSLKTNVPGLHTAMEDVYPGLRVYYDAWPQETVKAFYASQHVLIAPSRGEGKNMPALEFQSTGGTVIATNWGGHQQWLNKDYNYPLDYELVPIDAKHPDTLWAEANVEHLKSIMLHCFRNRDEVARKGEIASEVIPGLASWDNVIERLLLQIKNNVPNGSKVWDAAVMAKREA